MIFISKFLNSTKIYLGLIPRAELGIAEIQRLALTFFKEVWESASILKAENLPPELTNEIA
jgi:hypothetical protein